MKLVERLRTFGSLGLKDRIAVLHAFAESWFGPIPPAPADQVDAALGARPCPLALRLFYESFGDAIAEIWPGNGNHLVPPGELSSDDEGGLAFYAENQWIYVYEALPEPDGTWAPDPIVEAEDPGSGETPRIGTVSQVLLQILVFELRGAMRGALVARPTVEAVAAHRTLLEAHVPEIQAPPWQLFGRSVGFRAGEGLAAMDDERGLRLMARSLEDLAPLGPVLGEPEWKRLEAVARDLGT